jgi:hypothetical protein
LNFTRFKINNDWDSSHESDTISCYDRSDEDSREFITGAGWSSSDKYRCGVARQRWCMDHSSSCLPNQQTYGGENFSEFFREAHRKTIFVQFTAMSTYDLEEFYTQDYNHPLPEAKRGFSAEVLCVGGEPESDSLVMVCLLSSCVLTIVSMRGCVWIANGARSRDADAIAKELSLFEENSGRCRHLTGTVTLLILLLFGLVWRDWFFTYNLWLGLWLSMCALIMYCLVLVLVIVYAVLLAGVVVWFLAFLLWAPIGMCMDCCEVDESHDSLETTRLNAVV